MSELSFQIPFVLVPFRLVITQSLLIVVAIALEALILRRFLQYPPRKSVEYATSLNLFSVVIGWFFFLNLVTNFRLPPLVEQDLINLVLYDQWSNSTLAWTITAGLITFFATFFLEAIGLNSLQKLLDEEEALESQIDRARKRPNYGKQPRGLFSLSNQATTDPLYALLLANAASYSAIVAILALLHFGPRFL